MNLKALKERLDQNPNAANLSAAGLSLVPILPDGKLATEILGAWIEEGMPMETGFYHHFKLVSPTEMERRQGNRQAPLLDPLSQEPMSPAVAQAWKALAPFQCAFGIVVSAEDLCTYARARGLLASDLTSAIVRRFFEKGTAPVEPPEELVSAALEWPYDVEGPTVVERARRGQKSAAVAVERPVAAANKEEQGMVGSPGSLGASREAQLEEALLASFNAEELRRFVFYLPGGERLCKELPERCTLAELAHEAVGICKRAGAINAEFFRKWQEKRAGNWQLIAHLANLWGVSV